MDLVLDGVDMHYASLYLELPVLDRGNQPTSAWKWEYYQKTGMDNMKHTFTAVDSRDPSAPPANGTGTAFKLAM